MKPILILLIAKTILLTSAHARQPEPSFPDSMQISTHSEALTKIGEYRYVYRMLFKLYDAVLYAEPKAQSSDILGAQINFSLQFRYLRDIDKSLILRSSTKMLKRNLSPKELEQIRERIQKLNTAYTSVQQGDRSSLTYERGKGTTLHINGAPVITIEGQDFAELYFRIWLGEAPISSTLKSHLLGK